MVPFRPDDGTPAGKTVWYEVKVGIIARMGKRISQTGKEVSARKRASASAGESLSASASASAGASLSASASASSGASSGCLL